MAKLVTYSCPGAGPQGPHVFEYMHHPSSEPAPRYCPTCGYDSQADTVVPKIEFDRAIEAPHIRSGRAKAMFDSANQTYRQMEEGGQEMAYLAGEKTGENENGLKITNLKDNLQYGEAAAIEVPNNPVSQTMAIAPQLFGFQGGGRGRDAPGAAYGAMAHTGRAPVSGAPIPHDTPHAGAKSAALLGQFHQQHGHQIVASGEKGRF